MPPLRTLRPLVLAALLGAAPALAGTVRSAPATLTETGLWADFASRRLADRVLAFEPQYPLWTDGATKRRWILLPAGSAVDASDPDVWGFPVGTRVWKEFSLGRPIETRYMERLEDGRWLFATYLWSADGTRAELAPPRGVRGAAESAPGVPYDVPAVADCRACHGANPSGVLGFSALQLSGDRDPRAPHAAERRPGALDLATLVAAGLVVGLPADADGWSPRVAAADPVSRAALGYLHGNCSSCHNSRGPLKGLGLSLAVAADGTPEALATAVGRPARYRPAGAPDLLRVAPGDPEASLLYRRLGSREPILQMPPMGTHRVDPEALDLVARWIRSLRGPDPATGQSETTVVAHAPTLSTESLP